MLLLRPLAIVAPPTFGGDGGVGSGAAYVLTPSPKEVWSASYVSQTYIDIDMGAAVEIDSFYVGATNAAPNAYWSIDKGTGFGSGFTSVLAAETQFRRPEALGPRYAGFCYLAAPIAGRYFRITVGQFGAVPLQIGALMIGKAFVFDHEFGGGRSIVDTGPKEALPDGGFGIGEGVVKASLRWSFIDLDDASLRAMWAFAKDRGERKPILVVEDPADTVGRSERIHYGLFDRFESYERQAPGMTRWALSMTEWA